MRRGGGVGCWRCNTGAAQPAGLTRPPAHAQPTSSVPTATWAGLDPARWSQLLSSVSGAAGGIEPAGLLALAGSDFAALKCALHASPPHLHRRGVVPAAPLRQQRRRRCLETKELLQLRLAVPLQIRGRLHAVCSAAPGGLGGGLDQGSAQAVYSGGVAASAAGATAALAALALTLCKHLCRLAAVSGQPLGGRLQARCGGWQVVGSAAD